jgi:hypothetical protein
MSNPAPRDVALVDNEYGKWTVRFCGDVIPDDWWNYADACDRCHRVPMQRSEPEVGADFVFHPECIEAGHYCRKNNKGCFRATGGRSLEHLCPVCGPGRREHGDETRSYCVCSDGKPPWGKGKK